MARLTGDDWHDVVDHLQAKVHHTATAIKVIDFLISNWWWILALIVILAWLPRGRRSS